MLSLRKLFCLLMFNCVDCFVGVTLALRISAVFRDCFNLTHYRLGQALRAPDEGCKFVKLYTPAASFLLEAESIPGQ
jgi:hypothetical protein